MKANIWGRPKERKRAPPLDGMTSHAGEGLRVGRKEAFITGVAKTRHWLVETGCGYDLVDAKSVSYLHKLVRPAEHQPTLGTANSHACEERDAIVDRTSGGGVQPVHDDRLAPPDFDGQTAR